MTFVALEISKVSSVFNLDDLRQVGNTSMFVTILNYVRECYNLLEISISLYLT